jgi:hypothetical protein
VKDPVSNPISVVRRFSDPRLVNVTSLRAADLSVFDVSSRSAQKTILAHASKCKKSNDLTVFCHELLRTDSKELTSLALP